MSKQYNTYRNTKRTLRFAARCILGVICISIVSVFVYLLVYDIKCYKALKAAETELAQAVEENKTADPITIHIDGDGHDVTNKVESGDYQRVEVSDLEMYILSGSLRTLAANQPFECKKAVICVILNRMKYYDCTLEEVMQQPGQFEDTEQWYYGPACQEDTEAVSEAISDYTIPTTVFYYSLTDYPSWDDTEHWQKIGDYYFSLSKEVFNSYNCSTNKVTINPVQTVVTIH